MDNANIQTTLFGAVEVISPRQKKESKMAERKRKAKLCYDITGGAWKNAVHEFAVNTFLPDNCTFIFEALSAAYEDYAKEHGKPATIERRAFAGVRARLIKERLIEAVPGQFGLRSQGSASQIYRSNLYRG